jgi:hypothetical protein
MLNHFLLIKSILYADLIRSGNIAGEKKPGIQPGFFSPVAK